MFCVRIRFDVLNDYYINYESAKHELFREDEKVCTLSSVNNNEKISKASKLYIEYSSFENYQEALNHGTLLLQSLKLYCSGRGIPIKISGSPGETDSIQASSSTGGFTEHGRKSFGISDNVVSEVFGLGIYEVERSPDELAFWNGTANATLGISSFEINRFQMKPYDDKINTAISLISSSNVITDSRVSFLLKIMAVETLVSKTQKKEVSIIDKIDAIMDSVDDPEIRCYIGNYKNKSITEKSKELVLKSCGNGKLYNNMSATNFWNYCYRLRSKFVHFGTLDIDELHSILMPLREMINDIMNYYVDDYATS
jgi:hypothetical protein